MKRAGVIVSILVAIIFSATFVFAQEITIGINNNNDNEANATGGNAQQEQGQEQDQDQQQQQKMSNTYQNKREHITAIPGVVGSIAPLLPIVADGKWHDLLCDQYTIAELKNMVNSSSYANREGFYLFNLFKDPLQWTVRIKEYDGEINDNAIVRLAPNDPGNKVVAEAEGNGAKKTPLSAIVAYAALNGVQKTNEYSLVVQYRVRDIAKLSGIGVGSGAAGAVSSSDSARSGSLSVGAIIGYSEAYAEYVYDIRVKIVRASAAALVVAECLSPAPPPPPTPAVIEKPKPEPKPCDPEPIRKEIEKVEKEIRDCKFWSRSNLDKRARAAYLYLQLYNCTGKKDRSLLEKSIFHAKKAQQNYDEVHQHPKSRVVSRDNWDEKHAICVLKVTYWNEAAAIREFSGREAEIKYAREKGLERMPSSTDEIQEVR